MATIVPCTPGVPDCAISPAAGVCAPYNNAFDNVQSAEWLVVLAFLIMAVMAFYIGANDVANAFGTSVGSKAVSIRWACILGGVANWLGAVTLGYGVSTTVQQGIAQISEPNCWGCGYCDSQMSIYAVGMFSALIGAAFFLALATFTALPVSTTHAIVGGVVGVTIFAVGGKCLNWAMNGGLGGILASWVISPALSGVIGALIYLATHWSIMVSANPPRNAILALPILYAVCTFSMMLLILLKSEATKKWNRSYMVIVSAGVTGLVAVLVQLLLVPFVKKRLPSVTGEDLVPLHGGERKSFAAIQTPSGAPEAAATSDKDEIEEQQLLPPLEERPSAMSVLSSVISESEERFREEHNKLSADQKDAMFVFRYLIVMVATLESYAHGANDTANSTGPVSAIYNAYAQGLDTCGKKETTVWIMAIAGGFVCVGIIVQGHRVMRTIGTRISVMDMHRGFAMEFSSTVTVVVATLLQLPVSTTHCQVGSVFFVSLVSVSWRNVSFPMLGKIVFSWLVTLPFAGLVAVLFTAILRAALKH